MANYNSEFTGQQVDEAIQQVQDNHEDWSNKADPESVAIVAQAVVALQTAMNGKADLTTIFGAKRLNLNQVPLAFITYRNASATFPGRTGENNVTWLRYTDNLYRICYHNNGEDVVLGAPQNMLYYSGNGIYTWSGSQFQKIVDLTDYFEDGRLKMDALPENLPTGGLSDDIYTAIKDNVDTLWSKLNALIGDLANLAFRETKTSQLTNNDKTPWPENESSDQTPTLTKPANNGGTILVGTASGSLITTSVEIKGIHLTQQLVISVSGTGFSVSPSSISAADANAGIFITVTYNSTSLNTATGSLLISSSEVSRTANLLVLAGGGTTQTFSVTQNLTGCTSSYSANMVTEGTTLTIVLTPNRGRTFTGGTISATMNNVAVAVTDGSNGTKVISFGAVSGDIVIMATAVEQSAPSEITFTKPTIKRGVNIHKDSSGGTIILESKSYFAATTDWIALSGDWHKIVLYYNVPNNVDGYSVRLLCKYKNLNDGTTGVTPGNYSNIGNSNNAYNTNMNERTVSIERLVSQLYTGLSSGNYEITHIAFSVANNPNVEEDSENWGQYPYNNGTFTPGAANAKIYASEDDANPQVIFSADDPNSYYITNE